MFVSTATCPPEAIDCRWTAAFFPRRLPASSGVRYREDGSTKNSFLSTNLEALEAASFEVFSMLEAASSGSTRATRAFSGR